MLPNTKRNNGYPGLCFLLLLGLGKPVYWGLNSHVEWVQKTTLAGANRENFCFDWGKDT